MSRWELVAFVALGSNLIEPRDILQRAVAELTERVAPRETVRSSFWETEPVDCPEGTPDFINAVVGLPLAAPASARELLGELQEMERRYGRPGVHGRNAPRTLDLDIVTFGDLVLHEPDLVIPHPGAAQRLFVLRPLAEIDAEMVLPGTARTVAELIAAAPPLRMRKLGQFTP